MALLFKQIIILALALPCLMTPTSSPSPLHTRMPDPGPLSDTLCTVAVVEAVRLDSLENNTLVLWPKGTCCTTTDCNLQDFSCPPSAAHADQDGDICCFKESEAGDAIGYCRCGIDKNPEGSCF